MQVLLNLLNTFQNLKKMLVKLLKPRYFSKIHKIGIVYFEINSFEQMGLSIHIRVEIEYFWQAILTLKVEHRDFGRLYL